MNTLKTSGGLRRVIIAVALCSSAASNASTDSAYANSYIEPLSAITGELGNEIIHSPIDYSKTQKGPFKSVAYANIDDIDFGKSESSLMQVLKDAAKLQRPLFLESNNWDSAKLEIVARLLIGDQYVTPTGSALLFAEWTGSSWKVLRRFDEISATLGRRTDSVAVVPQAKALGGTTTIHPFYKYADKAFATDKYIAGSTLRYAADDNTFTIWNAPNSKCVLAWRGSVTFGDWYKNVVNQVSAVKLIDVPWDSNPHDPIVGDAYVERYNNKYSTIAHHLNNTTPACTQIAVTGHSLGGAMTLFTAYKWVSSGNTQTEETMGEKLKDVVAFNPARVGDIDFTSTVHLGAQVGPKYNLRSYCRAGDLVKDLPVGFQQLCTFVGADVSASASTGHCQAVGLPGTLSYTGCVKLAKGAYNHQRGHWTKCQSLTSC